MWNQWGTGLGMSYEAVMGLDIERKNNLLQLMSDRIHDMNQALG